ncbi:TetR family transcriptional regulator [Pseudidiomarina aestuarii]|uniref:TetR family transcriptional regulator n=1 Tax=Pseudidiomarina aestuarii TaxID=624146 RepID=A0A7Z7ETH8_9GAMM|nr:TetR/AcrR family transcriptional regulator [Pseudidiomarina aestuarii]RUO41091.1 TetR family transcriptional regulator [Pseudidiomarina aestuarii]
MPRPAKFIRTEAIASALQVFWQRGYHATSLKDLETALSMRPGSIYAAFGSKEGLFDEVLSHYAERSLTSLREKLLNRPSAMQGLREYLYSLANLGEREPAERACMLVKTLLELATTEPQLSARADAYLASMENLFCEVFMAAMQQNELEKGADPRFLAQQLQVAIFGLRIFSQRQTSPLRVRLLTEQIANQFTRVDKIA